jgi:hypothetical protein
MSRAAHQMAAQHVHQNVLLHLDHVAAAPLTDSPVALPRDEAGRYVDRAAEEDLRLTAAALYELFAFVSGPG